MPKYSVSGLAIGCRFPSAHCLSPGSVTGLACEIYIKVNIVVLLQ